MVFMIIFTVKEEHLNHKNSHESLKMKRIYRNFLTINPASTFSSNSLSHLLKFFFVFVFLVSPTSNHKLKFYLYDPKRKTYFCLEIFLERGNRRDPVIIKLCRNERFSHRGHLFTFFINGKAENQALQKKPNNLLGLASKFLIGLYQRE